MLALLRSPLNPYSKSGSVIVILLASMPPNISSVFRAASRKAELISVLEDMTGDDRVLLDDNLEKLLTQVKIGPESMVEEGLQFARRRMEDFIIYFIANHSASKVDAWVELASPGRSAMIMDPMTGRTGRGRLKGTMERPEIYLQMDPGESRILKIFKQEMPQGEEWPVFKTVGEPLELAGRWDIEFIEGGPYLPGKYQIDVLESWTNFNLQHAQSFAGAARYTMKFDLTGIQSDHFLLDLGDVRESARIWVNHKPAGVLVAHPFRLDISELLEEGQNEISIEVTNLSANRIRDIDTRGIEWRKFYDINFVSHLYEPFDASIWPLKPSGLLGPVKLIPIQITNL